MSSNINWQLKIRNKTYKTLSKFPKKDKGRIIIAIQEISNNPLKGDIEKMKDEENVWRRRIGNYRIFYELYFNKRLVLS